MAQALDDETKQPTLTQEQIEQIEQIQHLKDFELSGFATQNDYCDVTTALMHEISHATTWLSWVLDDEEVKNSYRMSRYGFFEYFRDAKYLCKALKVIEPKKMQVISTQQTKNEDQDRRTNIRQFIIGCKVLGVDSRFMVDEETLCSKQNITTADAVHFLCNIYAMYIASEEVEFSNLLKFRTERAERAIDECQKITNNVNQWLSSEALSPLHKENEDEKKLMEVLNSPRGRQALEKDPKNPIPETLSEPFKITDLSYAYVGRVTKEATKEAKPRMHGFGKLIFTGGMYIGQFQAGEMHGWGVLTIDTYDTKNGVWKVGQTYEGLWQASIWMGKHGSTSRAIAATRQEISGTVIQLQSDAWHHNFGMAQESLGHATVLSCYVTNHCK